MKKLVYGVGINDADYVVQRFKEESRSPAGKRRSTLIWICPYYRKWKEMLRRCFSVKLKREHTSYNNCTVFKDWLLFSNFKTWVDLQPDRDWANKQLDKDILIIGNKHYSPETCVFIEGRTNSFITDRHSARGRYLIGVSKAPSKTNPFLSNCQDPLKRHSNYLGIYKTELEAHSVWKACKCSYAVELSQTEVDVRVKKALQDRYK